MGSLRKIEGRNNNSQNKQRDVSRIRGIEARLGQSAEMSGSDNVGWSKKVKVPEHYAVRLRLASRWGGA